MIRLAVRATSSLNTVAELVTLVLIMAFVLGLAAFTSKWIAGYQKTQMRNRNLQVVETIKVTTNKYIQIVRAGEEYLVIAIGKDEMHLLTKLTKEQLDCLPEETVNTGIPAESFKDMLDKMKKHMPKK